MGTPEADDSIGSTFPLDGVEAKAFHTVPSRLFTDGAKTEASTHQETDIWWGSYAGRTMWLSFVVCIFLTALISWGAWYVWDEHKTDAQQSRWLVYGLSSPIWLIQLGRWAYRTLGINYRLTTHRLICDRGFGHPVNSVSVVLTDVKTVVVEQSLIENLVKVGRIWVLTDHSAFRPVLLQGVSHPEIVAVEIREAVSQAHASNQS